MLKNRKSQAALEFLMTYGWAILVVLIVISALAYFGVLNPQRLLPSKCTMPTGFGCQDYVANQGSEEIVVKLANGLGSAVTIIETNLTSMGTQPSCLPNPALPATGLTVTNGGVADLAYLCTGLSGSSVTGGDQKYRWEIVIRYHMADSDATFAKTVKGELFTTLEP